MAELDDRNEDVATDLWVVVVCPCKDCGHDTIAFGPMTQDEAVAFSYEKHYPYLGYCAREIAIPLIAKDTVINY